MKDTEAESEIKELCKHTLVYFAVFVSCGFVY